MTKLIIVRHGHSTANDSHCFAGVSDASLTAVGKQQAEYVGEYLAAREHIDKIYTSGMTRTVQTAMPTATRLGLPLHTEKGLREIFAGLWESLPYKELDRLYHDDWMGWIFDSSHARCTGGESTRQLYYRIKEAVFRLAEANEGKTLLLVTHSTPLHLLHAIAMGYSPEQTHLAPFQINASINVFHYERGALSLKKSNLVVYPPHLLRSSQYPQPPRCANLWYR